MLSSDLSVEGKPRDDTNNGNVFVQRSGSEGSEDDDYVPYVPVKIRKHQTVSYRVLFCFDTFIKDTSIRSTASVSGPRPH